MSITLIISKLIQVRATLRVLCHYMVDKITAFFSNMKECRIFSTYYFRNFTTDVATNISIQIRRVLEYYNKIEPLPNAILDACWFRWILQSIEIHHFKYIYVYIRMNNILAGYGKNKSKKLGFYHSITLPE